MADYGQPATLNARPQPAAAGGAPAEDAGAAQWTVTKLRTRYLDFLSAKTAEIKEQRSARHYYHGDQWTSTEIAELNKRRQPVVTYNRTARKINGVVGLLERLRQDPKAYPRTPKHAEGAELATAVLRYALDETDWASKSAEAARICATEGANGVALNITQGDHGDPEVELEPVDNEFFFYDARSFRADYSDSPHMGVGKWMDEDAAKQMFPDADIGNLIASDGELDSEATRDRAQKWTNTKARQIRVVDHWYLHNGQWCWCLYSGNTELARGVSPYVDEKGKTFCRYIMFAAAIDHDGDRYGFVRNLKSAQDEINHRRSKALFETMGRRLILEKGSMDDVDKARREANRPDGVLEFNPGSTAPAFDDSKTDAQTKAQLELMTEAKEEIDGFGPNPALIGEVAQSASGRSIALQQQSGLAELGPFIVAHKQWKVRVYRAVWNTIQRYWTAERWIRVTDDDGMAQFVQVNGSELDPQSGQPVMVNALGALDVDIILDEGPDTINMQADAYEALTGMGPAFVEKFPEAFVELAPLPEQLKKTMRDKIKAMQRPDPVAEKAKEIALAGEAAKVEETQAKTIKTLADAHAAGQPDMAQQAPVDQNEAKPPSIAINFKDMPPEAQAQALAEAGIFIHPQTLALHAQQQATQAAALKTAARPQPQL